MSSGDLQGLSLEEEACFMKKEGNLARPFMTLVAEVIKKFASLETQKRKVNKILGEYATRSQGATIENLMLLKVWDGKGDLHPELLLFIRRLPISKEYQQSQISNLRRLVKAVVKENFEHDIPDEVEAKKGSFFEANLPEFMRPLWLYLPRSGGQVLNTLHIRYDDPRRTALPLSPSAEALLATLLAVAQTREVDTLRTLLVDYRFELARRMRETYKPAKWRPAFRALQIVRGRMGFRVARRTTYSVPVNDLPKKLSEEIEVFLAHAASGLESMPHLSAVAAQFGLRDKPLRMSTVRAYVKAICYGFGFIECDTNISVEDLLRLRPVVRSFNRRTYHELHNPYVDQFRERELNRQAQRKRAGRDSVMFGHFVDAICTVGAFNGICEMQRTFKRAYKPNLDWRTRREIKALKKRVFDRAWIDSQITLLGAQVAQVINGRAYAPGFGGKDKEQALANLRKCMFYACFVMLRYTGFRQQCLRDCVLGENIIFGKDDSITLWWPEGAIKNNREINTTYSYVEHGETHATFIKVLNDYRKVYGYIEDSFGEEMGGQFFGYVTLRRKCAQNFANVTSFSSSFEGDGLLFLDFEGRLAEVDLNLNPHFLRGVATDWMKYDLGMTMEDIAKAIGSSVKILQREYLDEDRRVDPGGTLAKVNKRIKRARQEELGALMGGGESVLLKEINKLRSENSRIERRARLAEARAKREHRKVLELKATIKHK